MLINLCEKEVTGGRSDHVGRTVHQFDSFSSREVVSLAWAERLDCERSGPVVRTVRKYNSFLSREVAALFGLEGRTADGLPLGADSPQVS